MNYGYNTPSYINPYARANYGMPTYNQPQYAPQNQQQVMQPQPQIQQPQQPMQYEMPIQYVGYATLKEAEAYILMPNSKAIFIDKANGMYYEKTANNDGLSTIYQYKRIDLEGDKNTVTAQNDTPTIDLSNYVTKDRLGDFVSLKQYTELKELFEKLQKQVMGVKPNVGTTKQQM